MSKPSRLSIAVLVVIGAAFEGLAFCEAGSKTTISAVIGVLFGLVSIALLYAVNRQAWHRAAGWDGHAAEENQWSEARFDPAAIGRWSALGGGMSGVIFVLLATVGVTKAQFMAFLGASLGTVFFFLGFLWAFLLRSPKAGSKDALISDDPQPLTHWVSQ